MNLLTEPYLSQSPRWPATGRHILAQFDADSIIVYQAFTPDIGAFAAHHGHFGGNFSFSRMSWIKPNFLWMMYRSGWGTKPGQEITLAIRLQRPAFNSILRQAVHSTFIPDHYANIDAWQSALATSDVRLQWDPDHNPAGTPLPRRALQLGLRGPFLANYARNWILEIQDISAFVDAQRQNANGHNHELLTPREEVFIPSDHTITVHLGLNLEDDARF